jgi:hypothetical protein
MPSVAHAFCIASLLIASAVDAEGAGSPKSLSAAEIHRTAVQAFDEKSYAVAITLFRSELVQLDAAPDAALEREAREKLVLSLHGAGRKQEARTELELLRARFPAFRFDPATVSPLAIAELDPQALAAEPASEPNQTIRVAPAAAVSDAPRLIERPVVSPKWRWYYLAPLGIGQFLAGSPVRGSILFTAEILAIAANIVGAALMFPQLNPDGSAINVTAARAGQAVMNAGFVTLLVALTAGVVDGIFFEP